MDAKAKVVAWEVIGADGQPCYMPYRRKEDAEGIIAFHTNCAKPEDLPEGINSGYELMTMRELVTLTDHEAALAEQAERHAATERNACLMAELANEEKSKRLALLTGLEALAGEWEVRGLELESVGESEADFINAAALTSAANRLRRTLTNSAKGGTNGN